MSRIERTGIISRRVLSGGLLFFALSAGVHASEEATKGNIAGATLAGIEGAFSGYIGVKSWNSARRQANNEEPVPSDTIISSTTTDAEKPVDLQEGVGYTVIPPTPQGETR